MEVDDVVACILPEETSNIEDLSISIQRGFRFEERLTEEERESLIKHQVRNRKHLQRRNEPFTIQFQDLTILQEEASINMMGKGENIRN